MKIVISFLVLWCVSVHAHPLVSVSLSTQQPKQGDAFWVKINTSKRIRSGHIQIGKKKFKLFFKHPKEAIACLAVSRTSISKKTKVYFSFSFSDGSRYYTALPIQILSANFKKEHIKLKPKKYKLSQNKKGIQNEGQIIGKQFRKITSKKQYNGPFKMPVNGRLTSPFGNQRIYNGTPSWSHSGIDISAVEGTPIKAPQNGTIILSKQLNVHGNTIMIDHGWGIVSIYNHLHQRFSKLNDKVVQGDIIGTVGSTGIATGSHLHFGISVQGIRINPKHWVETISFAPF